MIKLTDLLNESTPGFDKRKFGDALPTLDSVTKAHQAKLKLADLMKEESFTAVNKDSGKVSVFDTKDARDAAVKSGTHDKKEDEAEKGGDSAGKKKANMFSKDAGYDAPDDDDDDDDDDDYEIDDSDEDVVDLPQEVQDEFEDSVKDLGYSWADIGTIPGVISFMDKDENAVMVSTGAAYGGDEPFYVSGYNLPDMEDGDSDETNGKSFDTKEDAMAYAKELAQTLKGGEAKEEPKSEPTKLKYSKDGKMTQDSADSINKELNAELGVDGMTDINLDTGTIEYFLSDDSEEAVFIGKEEGGNDIAVSFGDGGDEYKTFKNSKDAVAYAKELGNQLKGGEGKEEPKSEPTKDSTQQRAGNTEVNKSVRNQAKKLGITPAKLGKEEYQKAMVGAAYEALTDSNFSTEARQLLAVITGNEKLAEKPDYPSMSDKDYDTKIDKIRKDREAGDIYTTPENDKASELGQHSSSESSWSGADAIDAIAFDLKMNGYKDLASKIQSVIKED